MGAGLKITRIFAKGVSISARGENLGCRPLDLKGIPKGRCGGSCAICCNQA
jgi:hypothetical protein